MLDILASAGSTFALVIVGGLLSLAAFAWGILVLMGGRDP